MSALLVVGTTSDAGKSIVTTGLCRAFSRRGLKVALFTSQNRALATAGAPASLPVLPSGDSR